MHDLLCEVEWKRGGEGESSAISGPHLALAQLYGSDPNVAHFPPPPFSCHLNNDGRERYATLAESLNFPLKVPSHEREKFPRMVGATTTQMCSFLHPPTPLFFYRHAMFCCFSFGSEDQRCLKSWLVVKTQRTTHPALQNLQSVW